MSNSAHPALSAVGLSLLPNFQNGGWGGGGVAGFKETWFLQGFAWKEGVVFFREVAVLTWKINFNKIFNDKKSLYTQNFLSVMTKTLNWEILTKNLVTFKRWDIVKDEKF